MSELDEIKSKSSVSSNQLYKIKVNCTLSLTLEEYEVLCLHAEKTGGTFVKRIVAELEPSFKKVKQAIAILEG